MGKDKAELMQIADKFCLDGEKEQVEPYGSGHINDTYLLICRIGDEKKNYILQRMNHEVFKDPEGLMENVVGVKSVKTEEIRKGRR